MSRILSAIAKVMVWVLAGLVLSGTAIAQETPPKPDELMTAAAKEAEAIERRLKNQNVGDTYIQETRSALVARQQALTAAAERAKNAMSPLKDQLSALGQAPKDGAAERPEVAKQRKELAGRIAELESVMKRAQQAAARTTGLLDRLGELRRERFAHQLMRRGPSPVNPDRIARAYDSIGVRASAIAREISARLDSDVSSAADRLALPLILALIAFVLGVNVRLWLLRRIRTRLTETLSAAARARSSLAISATRLVLPAIAIVMVTVGLQESGVLGPTGARLLDALVLAAAIIVGVNAASTAYFAPWTPTIRLSGLDDPSARSAHSWLIVLAVAVALDRVFVVSGKDIRLTIDALAVINGVLLLVGGVALWRFIHASGIGRIVEDERIALTDSDLGIAQPQFLARLLRLVGRAIAVGAPLLALIGYYGMSRFIFYPVIYSAALIGVTLLVHLWVHGLTEDDAPRTAEGEAGDTIDATGRLGAIPVLVGFILALAALPILAMIWGAGVSDLRAAWFTMVDGFKIGKVTIAPQDFLIFAIVFALGYFLTRAIQGVLRRSVMPLLNVDDGAKAALLAGIGYVGVVITALVAISTTGVDLSNLAIVAGALSVGIGFGLQNVVNNFVSGIILLIERPIKVGDWVEIGGTHGMVRKITVRSTQIQKFDRSTMFVPNADLISGTVTNWYHGDGKGRLIVEVGVAYGSDARQVERILMDVAEGHPMVVRTPGPFVVFKNFGADALEFELRGIMADVNMVLTLPSELRYSIYRRFVEEGIEIPFRQQDVFLKNIDEIASALRGEPRPGEPAAADERSGTDAGSDGADLAKSEDAGGEG